MSAQVARNEDVGLSLLAPGDPDSMSSNLFDEHGAALFRLAHMICRNVEMASCAVVQAFDAAFTDNLRTGKEPRIAHDLARLTYLACTLTHPVPSDPTVQDQAAAITTTEPQRRALLALTMHGDHTYAEAAALLYIDPDTAAQALRTTLLAHTHPPTSPG